MSDDSINTLLKLLLKNAEQSDFFEEQLDNLKKQSQIHREQLEYVKKLLDCVESMVKKEPTTSTTQDYSKWDSTYLLKWQKSRTATVEKSANLRKKFIAWFRNPVQGLSQWSHTAGEGSVPIIIPTRGYVGMSKKEYKIPWQIDKASSKLHVDHLESVWPACLGVNSNESFTWDLGDEARRLHATHFSYSYNEHGSPEWKYFEKVPESQLCYEYYRKTSEEKLPWGQGNGSVFGSVIGFYDLPSIPLSCVAFVLSHYEGLFDFALNFLLCYAWCWKTHSIYKRPAWFEDTFCFQFHIRYIVLDSKDNSSSDSNCTGIQLMRDGGLLLDIGGDESTNKHFMREGRASIAVSIPLKSPLPACYTIFSFAEELEELAGQDLPFKNESVGELAGMRFVIWRIELMLDQCTDWWSKVLDELDAKLRVTIAAISDRKKRYNLIYGPDYFKTSELYFGAQQLLRVCSDWISETTEDLECAHIDCIGRLVSTVDFVERTTIRREDVDRLDLRFMEMRKKKDDDSHNLLNRIERKRKEIESLGTELLNATNVRNANTANRQSTFILLFTIITVFYLPLTFVTSVFGMHLFDTDDAKVVKERKPFFITIFVFAAATYISALIGYLMWRRLHPSGDSGVTKQGRGSERKETQEKQGVMYEQEFHDSGSSLNSFAVPLRIRQFRLDTIV